MCIFRQLKCDRSIDCADASDEDYCNHNGQNPLSPEENAVVKNLAFDAEASLLSWEEPVVNNITVYEVYVKNATFSKGKLP